MPIIGQKINTSIPRSVMIILCSCLVSAFYGSGFETELYFGVAEFSAPEIKDPINSWIEMMLPTSIDDCYDYMHSRLAMHTKLSTS